MNSHAVKDSQGTKGATSLPARPVGYEEICQGLETLCQLIAASPDGWWPDAIVAVARGGLVPATHVCHYFDRPVCFIYDDALLGTLDGHHRVLVVDEINDTGSALQRIRSRIFSQPPNDGFDVRYAVLYTRHTTSFQADYFLDSDPYFLRDATWQNFPWERS